MRMNPGKAIQNKINGVKQNFADYKKLDSKDKKTYWKEFLLNNALYILLIVAIIYTYIQNSVRSEPSHCLWYCGMYRIDRY